MRDRAVISGTKLQVSSAPRRGIWFMSNGPDLEDSKHARARAAECSRPPPRLCRSPPAFRACARKKLGKLCPLHTPNLVQSLSCMLQSLEIFGGRSRRFALSIKPTKIPMFQCYHQIECESRCIGGL